MASRGHVLGRVLSLLAVLAVSTSCATSVQATPTRSVTSVMPTPASSPSASSPRAAGATSGTVSKHVSQLLVVVLENHSETAALRQMPRLAAQADRYGIATNWYAVAHPSLPNYLELTAGSTFGVTDDGTPAEHRLRGETVFGQLTAHGRSAVTYAESMPSTCYPTNSGRYAVRHNPALLRRGERAQRVPRGRRPGGKHHDRTVAPRRVHRPDADLLTVVAAARLHHTVVTRRFTHASLAAAPSRLAGLPPLRQGAGSPDVLRAFGLR